VLLAALFRAVLRKKPVMRRYMLWLRWQRQKDCHLGGSDATGATGRPILSSVLWVRRNIFKLLELFRCQP